MNFNIFLRLLETFARRISRTDKLIRRRLDFIKQMDAEAHATLITQIEFQPIRRQKLRFRRLIRRFVLRREDTRGKALSRRDFVRLVNDSDGEKVVLFVARHPTHDFLKASDYIRRHTGYKTALLMYHPTLRPVMEKHFDGVWVYPSFYHLCSSLIQLNPWVIHAQGSSSFYPFPVLATALNSAPVVAQVMDIPSLVKPTKQHYEGRGGAPERALDQFVENFVYRHAAGVTIFNYQISVTERYKTDTPSAAPVIEFHNYPAAKDIVVPKSRQTNNDDVHIVYAGVVEPSTLPKAHFGDLHFHSLIKKITSQGLHFHLYPSPQYEPSSLRKYLDEYIQIDAANPFFHYHDPVPPGQTAEELSQYDYAAMLYTLGEVPEYDFERLYRESGTMGSKVFTYIEAGLPTIVADYVAEPARMINKFGNGLVIEEDQIDQLSTFLADQNYGALAEGVIRAQQELSLEIQGERLQKLYEIAGASGGD